MSKGLAIAFGIGLVIMVAVVAYMLSATKGNHLEPTGHIDRVRTASVDDTHSALIVDFDVTNPSDRDMVVRTISIAVTEPDGSTPEASPVAATDLPRLFAAHPELGSIDRPAMRERDKVPAHRSLDGTSAVMLEIPESELRKRKSLHLEIEDITGPTLSLTAK